MGATGDTKEAHAWRSQSEQREPIGGPAGAAETALAGVLAAIGGVDDKGCTIAVDVRAEQLPTRPAEGLVGGAHVLLHYFPTKEALLVAVLEEHGQ
ncbi:hypothetical protein ABZ547_26750 [Streptomyces sparsogenes]|uniref:hypothetical protein n=1 Tax=Streptomyces sparsogenes TaxID=67365 RepID=UPI0033C848A4